MKNYKDKFNLPKIGEQQKTSVNKTSNVSTNNNMAPTLSNQKQIQTNQLKNYNKNNKIGNEQRIYEHNIKLRDKYQQAGKSDIATRYDTNAKNSLTRLNQYINNDNQTKQPISNAFTMTQQEYNSRRRVNNNLPEYGSYDYYKDRERKLRNLIIGSDETVKKSNRNYEILENFDRKYTDGNVNYNAEHLTKERQLAEQRKQTETDIINKYKQEYKDISDKLGEFENERGIKGNKTARTLLLDEERLKKLSQEEIEKEIRISNNKKNILEKDLYKYPQSKTIKDELKFEKYVNEKLNNIRLNIINQKNQFKDQTAQGVFSGIKYGGGYPEELNREYYIKKGQENPQSPFNKNQSKFSKAFDELYFTPKDKEYIEFLYGYYDNDKADEKLQEYIMNVEKRKLQKSADESFMTRNLVAPMYEIAGNLLSPVYGLEALGHAASRNMREFEEPLPKNTAGNMIMDIKNMGNEVFIGDSKGAERIARETFISIANNLTNRLIFGNAGLTTMALQAGSGETHNKIEQGATVNEALLSGAISGGLEYLTEKLPYDMLTENYRNVKNLLKNGNNSKKALKKALIQYTVANIGSGAFTEALEEGTNNIFGVIADNIIQGEKSEYNMYINKLKEEGYSDKAAKESAFQKFYLKDTLSAAASGALSGAIMNAGAVSLSSIDQYRNFRNASESAGNGNNDVTNFGNEDVKFSLDGRGNGYFGYSMSNNAVDAYANGEMPLSKWNKSNIIEALSEANPNVDFSKLNVQTLKQNMLKQSSWHHTSKYFNKTNFYELNREYVENLTQEEVDSMAANQSKIFTHQRDTSLDEQIDDMYNTAQIIYNSGVTNLKTFNGVLKKVLDGTIDYDGIKNEIKKNDSAKVQKWANLPQDHWRQEYVTLYNNNFDNYLEKMYVEDKLNRNSTTFKKIKDVVATRTSELNDDKYAVSQEIEEGVLNDGERNNAYNGSVGRSVGESAAITGGSLYETAERVEGFSRQRTDTESARRIYAENVRTVQGSEVSQHGNLKIEIIKSEYYTDDMRAIEESNRNNGIRNTYYILGNGEVTDNPDIKFKGAITEDGDVYIQCDNINFSPEQINKHELVHKNYNTEDVVKVRQYINDNITEQEKRHIIDEMYSRYALICKGDENKVFEEFVCDVLSGMNSYDGRFNDITQEYWESHSDITDSYSAADYSGSVDSGGTGETRYSTEVTKTNPDKIYDDDNIPQSFQKLENSQRYQIRKSLKNIFSIQPSDTQNLKKLTDNLIYEYQQTGIIGQETKDKLFDFGFKAGKVVNREMYDKYEDLRKNLREKKIYVPPCTAGDIEGYNDLRKKYIRTALTTSNKDNSVPIEDVYNELSEQYPELFPSHIINNAEQLLKIWEAVDTIKKTYESLETYYGENAEQKVREKFDVQINNAINDLFWLERKHKEYEQQIEKAEKEILTPEAGIKLCEDIYRLDKEYGKVQGRFALLIDIDKKILKQLEDGTINPDEVKDSYNGQIINRELILEAYNARKELKEKIKQWEDHVAAVRKKRETEAMQDCETSSDWEEKKGANFSYHKETMWRNGHQIGMPEELVDKYFNQPEINEALKNKFIENQRQAVRRLELNADESYLVQFLGETESKIKALEQYERPTKEQKEELDRLKDKREEVLDYFKGSVNLDKVYNAIAEFKNIYSFLLKQINTVRVKNGYKAIGNIEDYFPHYTKVNDKIEKEKNKVLKKKNEEKYEFSIFKTALQDMGIEGEFSLPTKIAGRTGRFKPGTVTVLNFMERTGDKTSYDAVYGFDRYIEMVADAIFHTDDIQRIRGLGQALRNKHSPEGLKQTINKIREEGKAQGKPQGEIENEIQKEKEVGFSHLNGFVQVLDEYANQLANKKSELDRSMENLVGRRIYNIGDALAKKTAANAVAMNLASACTNFIPLTQMTGMVPSKYILAGLTNYAECFGNDFITENSVFLTNRKGSCRIDMNTMQKLSTVLSKPMEIIDMFTSNVVVRSKYLHNISMGMTSQEALSQADRFANNLMASRTKASLPTIFNAKNPIVKAFTMFQVEVKNQYSAWRFDMPREIGKQLKSGKKEELFVKLWWGRFKALLFAYLFNDIYEKVFGRRSATDPIGIANGTVGEITGYRFNNGIDAIYELCTGKGIDSLFKKSKPKELKEALKNTTKEIAEEVPFIGSVLGGGRIQGSFISPIQEIPNLVKGTYQIATGDVKNGAMSILADSSTLIYPFGGSQIKKTIKGLDTVINGGSYVTDKNGKKIMQFPVTNDSAAETMWNYFKGTIGGKTALDDYAKWDESGRRNLSDKELQIYNNMTDNSGISAKKQNVYQTILDLRADDSRLENETSIKYIHRVLSENPNLNAKENSYYKYYMMSDSNQAKISGISDMGKMDLDKATEMYIKYTPDTVDKDGNKISGAEYYYQYLPDDAQEYVDSTTYTESSTDVKKLALLYDNTYSAKEKTAYEKYATNHNTSSNEKKASGFSGSMDYSSPEAFYYSALSDTQKNRYTQNKYLFPNMDSRTYFYYLKEATTQGTSKKDIINTLMYNNMTYQEATKFYDMAFSRKKQFKPK